MTEIVSPRLLLWLGAGFVIWSGALVILYALHAIGCAFAWPTGPLRLGLGAVLVVLIVVLATMWRRLASRRAAMTVDGMGDFLVTLSLWATMAATVVIVFTLGLPTLLLTACF